MGGKTRHGKQERKSAHEQESQEEMKQTLLFHISSSPRPQLEDGGVVAGSRTFGPPLPFDPDAKNAPPLSRKNVGLT